MTNGTQTIAGLIPTFQAAALAGHNIGFAKKKDKTAKDFLEMGTTNIVGTSLIQQEAQLIGLL